MTRSGTPRNDDFSETTSCLAGPLIISTGHLIPSPHSSTPLPSLSLPPFLPQSLIPVNFPNTFPQSLPPIPLPNPFPRSLSPIPSPDPFPQSLPLSTAVVAGWPSRQEARVCRAERPAGAYLWRLEHPAEAYSRRLEYPAGGRCAQRHQKGLSGRLQPGSQCLGCVSRT